MKKILKMRGLTRHLFALAMAVVLTVSAAAEPVQTVSAKTADASISLKESLDDTNNDNANNNNADNDDSDGDAANAAKEPDSNSDTETSSDTEPEVNDKAKEITQITVGGKPLNDGDSLYPADTVDTNGLVLGVKLDTGEDCGSSIEWSVSPNQETVNITKSGQSTMLVLNGIPDGEDFVAADITAVVGDLTKTVSISVKRKQRSSFDIKDIDNLEYGDTDKTLSIDNITPGKEEVYFELKEGEEIADVDGETGGLNIKKTGTFKVKATIKENGYYEEASATKEFTAGPRKVGITLAEGVISKISDGNKKLTKANESAISGLIQPTRILENDNTTLSFDVSGLEYDAADIYIDGGTDAKAVYNNHISLGGLKDIKLENNDDNNYVLDMDAVENLKKLEVPAYITPVTEKDNIYDMTSSEKNLDLGTFGIVLNHGIQGSNKDKSFWYDRDGVKIDIPQGQGLELLTADMENAVDDKGYLSAESESPVYVRQTQGDAITYYGPYIVKYQKDETVPDITAVRVVPSDSEEAESVETEPVEGVEFRTYTIIVSDDKSGINDEKIKCVLKNGNKETTVTIKQDSIEEGEYEYSKYSYSFEVSVPASGKIYVTAEDMVGNQEKSKEICALVVEEDKPEVTISIDNNTDNDTNNINYAQIHSVTITAEDKGTDDNEDNEDSEDKALQSGIQKICYSIEDSKGKPVGDVMSMTYDAPKSLEDLANTLSQTWIVELGEESDKIKFDGEYTITAWAYDQCGNISDKASVKLYFDNTAPSVTITMDDKYEFYHRKDNCGITVSFEHERIGDGGSYSVVVSDERNPDANPIEISGVFSDAETVTIDAAELKDFNDGEVIIKVIAVDAAGNEAKDFKEVKGCVTKEKPEDEDKPSGESGLAAYFILDNTPPVLKGIASSGTAKNPDSTAYYYNDEKVEIKYTVEETNPPENWNLFYTKNGTKVTLDDEEFKSNTEILDFIDEASNESGVILALIKEGRYSDIGITGEDRAGNKLILDADYSHEICDKAETRTDDEAEEKSDLDGAIVLEYGKVLDWTSPIVELTFSEPHSVYDDTSYYGEGGFSAEIYVSDSYPLIAEMFSYSMGYAESLTEWSEDEAFGDKLEYEEDKTLASGDAEADENKELAVTVSETDEGYYAVRIKGTDRAGNAADVKEYVAVSENERKLLEEVETKIEDEEAKIKDGEASYYISCNKIIDTTAPTAVIEFNELAEAHIVENGMTSYYNKAISASIVCSDNNALDGERIKYYISNPMPTPVEDESKKIDAVYPSDAECSLGEDVSKKTELIIAKENSDNGVYVLKLSGEDKAGNHLIVTEKIGIGEAGIVVQDSVKTDEDVAFTSCNKVYDTENPKAVIKFTDLDKSHIYENTSYYRSSYGAELVCTDNNVMDSGRVSYQISEKVPTPLSDERTKITAYNDENILHPAVSGDTLGKLEAKIDMPEEDGAYGVRIKGEDKAGNTLIIEEWIGENCVDVSGNDVEVDGYFLTGNKVYDSINPTYTFEITDIEQKHILDNTAYYNGDIKAEFEIEDINFDGKTLAGTAISTEAQAGDYSSYVTKWVDVSMGDGFVGVSADGKYKYTQSVSRDGVYRFELQGEDKAGNPIVPADSEKDKSIYNTLVMRGEDERCFWSYNKVRDTEAPTGTVVTQEENGNIYYKIAIESAGVEIAEPYRDENEAVLNISASDNSPVRIDYSIYSTADGNTTEYLGDEFSYKPSRTQTLKGAQIFKLTDIVITDMAGNDIKLASTNSIYLDIDAPTVDELAPTIKVAANSDGNAHTSSGTPLFKESVPLSIKVSDPYAGKKSSGLGLVTYELYIDDKLVEADSKNLHEKGRDSWKENYEDPALEFTIDTIVNVSAQEHNYNNIKVVVEASDNAGNKNKAEYKFGIDITPPVIEINYDNNSAENEKYFKADRTATITVKERNFDPNRMSVTTKGSIGSWSRISTSGDNGDGDKWAASVKYTVDDVYTLEVTGADRVGNSAKSITYNGTAPRDFVLDKTLPVINVTYNNNNVSNEKYYNAGRTATITVEDVNFAGTNSFSVDALAGGTSPAVGFNGKTAVLPFDTDGNYSFRGTVTDMAGNESAEYVCAEFVIDTKRPVVEIDRLIMDEHGVITPKITITDNNLDPESCEITLTRNAVSLGSRFVESSAHADVTGEFVPNRPNWSVSIREYDEDRAEINLLDPGHDEQRNDGIYTLEVRARDKANWSNIDSEADNETEGIVRKYVVNRYGTVYEYSDGLLSMEDTAYCRKESDGLYIKAYNASEFDLEESAIKFEVRCDGEVLKTELNPNIAEPDRSVSGWYEYQFDITAKDFQTDESVYRDGRYEFVISDRDKSGNTRTNSSNPLSFYIDSTKPVLENITGLEEDHYYGAEKAVSYSVSDAIGLAGVKVYIDDSVVDEVDFVAEDGNQTVYSGSFTVGSGMWQNIRFEVTDRAGNVFDTDKKDDETLEQIKKFGFKFCPVITVSTNVLKLWYAQRALFWGSIAGIVSLLAIIVVIIILKRRKNECVEE